MYRLSLIHIYGLSCHKIVIHDRKKFLHAVPVKPGPEKGEQKMTDKVIENNQVIIMGKIVSDFEFSHEIFGEGFYMVDVEVARLSDSYDIIPLMVSERLLDVEEDYKGCLLYTSRCV